MSSVKDAVRERFQFKASDLELLDEDGAEMTVRQALERQLEELRTEDDEKVAKVTNEA